MPYVTVAKCQPNAFFVFNIRFYVKKRKTHKYPKKSWDLNHK